MDNKHESDAEWEETKMKRNMYPFLCVSEREENDEKRQLTKQKQYSQLFFNIPRGKRRRDVSGTRWRINKK